jgi:hypothetical protein
MSNAPRTRFFITVILVMSRRARKIRKARMIWMLEKLQLMTMTIRSKTSHPSSSSVYPRYRNWRPSSTVNTTRKAVSTRSKARLTPGSSVTNGKVPIPIMSALIAIIVTTATCALSSFTARPLAARSRWKDSHPPLSLLCADLPPGPIFLPVYSLSCRSSSPSASPPSLEAGDAELLSSPWERSPCSMLAPAILDFPSAASGAGVTTASLSASPAPGRPLLDRL